MKGKTGRNADIQCRSPKQVMDRLDELISDIRTRFHKPAMSADRDDALCADVLIVAHGHILRAFAMRWIGRQLTDGVSLLLEGESETLLAGGVKDWQSIGDGDGHGRGGWSG